MHISIYYKIYFNFPGDSGGKESACNNARDLGLIPGSGKIPWKKKWQPSPVFLLGEFRGQRSLAGYSPWSGKELDTTEQLTFYFIFKTLTVSRTMYMFH